MLPGEVMIMSYVYCVAKCGLLSVKINNVSMKAEGISTLKSTD